MNDEPSQADSAGKTKHRPLSLVLDEFSAAATGDITFADLRDALGDRAFAALLVLFSAVNLIPITPPGTTLVFGIPPLVIAVQMVLGFKKLWMPRFILDRPISAERFQGLMSQVTPRLRKMEQYIRPRYWPFSPMIGERLVGLLCALLSILVILPIPGANWVPAFAMVLMGLSLTERDGLLLMTGLAIGTGFLVAFATVIDTAAHHLQKFF
jgi:hypothetical protein